MARAEAKILTRLLPNNIAPINFSGLEISFSTSFAFLSPSLDNLCMLEAEAAVRDVSEPEKNPEKIINTTIMANIPNNSISMISLTRFHY